MSALQLISHRMLVSALPHQVPQDTVDDRALEGSAISAPLQVLPGRDLSEIMDRDDATFRTRRSDNESHKA